MYKRRVSAKKEKSRFGNDMKYYSHFLYKNVTKYYDNNANTISVDRSTIHVLCNEFIDFQSYELKNIINFFENFRFISNKIIIIPDVLAIFQCIDARQFKKLCEQTN